MTETLGSVIEDPIANIMEDGHYQLKTGDFNSVTQTARVLIFGINIVNYCIHRAASRVSKTKGGPEIAGGSHRSSCKYRN
jgi:hypothetical protein